MAGGPLQLVHPEATATLSAYPRPVGSRFPCSRRGDEERPIRKELVDIERQLDGRLREPPLHSFKEIHFEGLANIVSRQVFDRRLD